VSEPLEQYCAHYTVPCLLARYLFCPVLLHPYLFPLARWLLMSLPLVCGPCACRQARIQRSLAPLLKFPRINASHPIVAQFAGAVDEALAPWRPVEGVQDGMARGRGLISPRILKAIAYAPRSVSPYP